MSDNGYGNFAVPSQFTNNIPDARKCIANGDYFGMEGVDTSVKLSKVEERCNYLVSNHDVGAKVNAFDLTWPLIFIFLMFLMSGVYWFGFKLIIEQWLKFQ